MSRKNLLSESISGLKDATKNATKQPAAKTAKTAEVIEARRGKSSDPAWQGVNIYIRKQTHLDAKRELLGEAADLSDLIEHLLSQWVSGRTSKG